MSILQNVRILCYKNDISVNKLEQTIGFGKGTIGTWERCSPSVDKLILIADYFNVSLDELCGRSLKKSIIERPEQHLSDVTPVDLLHDDNFMEVMKIYGGITPNMRAWLNGYIACALEQRGVNVVNLLKK